jgi:hypothetical protein
MFVVKVKQPQEMVKENPFELPRSTKERMVTPTKCKYLFVILFVFYSLCLRVIFSSLINRVCLQFVSVSMTSLTGLTSIQVNH